ncbi:MAG TPA: hypothetical protein VMW87_04530 [Spirochaetia bacterium]|nr:hypothetical protein [Spirochaetia bacterium]
MAQASTVDQGLVAIYKNFYIDGVENLLFRNDPVVKMMKKERVTGGTVNFAALSGRGGAVSGNYQAAIALATTTAQDVQFAVPPGKIFGCFIVTKLEKLASANLRGAFIPAAVDRMFACLEGVRKAMAACLYGSGYGELGVVYAAVAQAATTMWVPNSCAVKLEVGMQFQVTDGSTGLPSDPLVAGGPYTVTAMSDSMATGIPAYPTGTQVTFTPGAPAATFVAGAWVEMNGGRDTNGKPNMPTGLGMWTPGYFQRTGAAWNTYIGTAIYGVTRSANVPRLAGSYVLRPATQSYSDTVIQGLQRMRRAGGVPDWVVINDEDLLVVLQEMNAQTTYFQDINKPDAKAAENEVERGLSRVGFQFSSSWLKTIVDTPYCPKGYTYILDSKVIKFEAISNVEEVVNDGVPDNNPGVQNVDAARDPGEMFQFNIDDFLNVVPNTASTEGPAELVTVSIFGNFMMKNTAHACLIDYGNY